MPGTPAPYTIIVHLLFDSIDSFETAFTPHAAEIVADVPNYTATDPIIQLSEVVG
jgi:uncharacterized protein (TIGR02118 family)